MTTFEYPSDSFPPFPAIRVEVPDSWSPVLVPSAVMAARGELAPGRFAPNVVVSVVRFQGGFGPAEAAILVRNSVRPYPDAKIDEPFTATFGDIDFQVVNVAYEDQRIGTLVQVHAYRDFKVPGHDNNIDVVHVMGTCAAAHTATDYPLLQQVMESVRVRPHGLGTGWSDPDAAAPMAEPDGQRHVDDLSESAPVVTDDAAGTDPENAPADTATSTADSTAGE